MKKILSLILLISSPAIAHDAPSGWTYGSTCCSTTDCRPVDSPSSPHPTKVKVFETAQGYRIFKPGSPSELIPWNDTRIRQSKDEDYHLCTTAGMDNTRTLCLYVPLRSY